MPPGHVRLLRQGGHRPDQDVVALLVVEPARGDDERPAGQPVLLAERRAAGLARPEPLRVHAVRHVVDPLGRHCPARGDPLLEHARRSDHPVHPAEREPAPEPLFHLE